MDRAEASWRSSTAPRGRGCYNPPVAGRAGAKLTGAAALALALVNSQQVNAETKPAEADGGQLLDLSGGTLHVVTEGPEDAPPLVLLHGFAGSLRWFDRLAPLLTTDHRVVRVDLLGHGGSAKPATGYALENQAALVGQALDRLGVEGAALVGHSFGGAVAVALAEARPQLVPGLVVFDEGPDESFGGWPFLSRLGLLPVVGELAHRVAPDSMIADGYKDAFAPDFDFRAAFSDPDQVVRDYRRMTFHSYKASTRAESRFLEEERLDDRLRRLGVPALVAFGEHDRFFRASDCARAFQALPEVRVEILDGVGHSPPLEVPERAAELVRSAIPSASPSVA